ncbi:general secretion pathway protein F (plasmid) [Nitratiruptor sp. YY08-26]|uniref:type II secretion system F family protein n=1 Tax=unclassified Nitratiruptor TaxID=2624044 RepID=UPI0018EBC050|nr:MULTISPECIES: type II secretion system F family protein [unclassified Nitratiruptor]BCD63171.1 general secretion pathway protein F [Nitratiruptor sp. YY08-13]BCD67107.1 general secretion pathway protein F [Nitratiruptor sp. YY08-26]
MIFKYKGIDKKSGKSVKGVIEAQDLQEAKARLLAKNILFTSIKEHTASLLEKISFKRKGTISNQELATLSRDLAIYLRAGIPIANALRLAQNQYASNKKLYNFLGSIITYLDEGKSFYQALDAQSIIELPTFYKQSIKVAENSGTLEDVLEELATFLKEQDRINKQIQSAFAYPMFIIIVSIFMVGFMISYVVPKITAIFVQMKQELPPITQFVVDMGNFFKNYWLEMGITIVVLVILFSLLVKYNQRFKYMVDYLMLKLPFLGKIIQVSELARFSYMASVLLDSGIPFVQAINLASKILKNSVIQQIFEEAASKVVEGSKFSTALIKHATIIDRSFVQAIALGEETSQVPVILKNLSELYLEENRDKIAIFLSLLEPMLMLIVGGIIGFIITAMLLPIFSINIQG